MQKILISFLILLAFPQVVKSQDLTTFSVKNEKIKIVLRKIEKEFSVKFSYQDKWIKNKKITLDIKNANLKTILLQIENKTNLKFSKINARYYAILQSKVTLNEVQHIPPIHIKAYLTKGIIKTNNSYFIISPKKLGVLAGLTEADIFESLHQFPAVTNPSETATEISVRGGNTDQNNILFDQIPIYHKGHLFGMISPINPSVVDKILFYNKATNPKFNDKISSVISINTEDKIHKKSSFNIGINGIHLDANALLPLVENKLQIQISARRSFAELLESPTFVNYQEKAFQTTKINISKDKIFNFSDYVFKTNFAPNTKNQFYFSAIFMDNQLDFTVDKLENQIYNDVLKTKNYGSSLKWNRKYNSNATQKTSISFSDYNLRYTHLNYNDNSFLSSFHKRNQIYDVNFQTEVTLNLVKKSEISFGYRFNFKNASYTFKQQENGNSFILDTDNTTVKTHQLFGNYVFNTNNYEFKFGSAINYYQELSKFKIAPRLLISKQFTEYFKLETTAELKNQNIYQIDETVLSDLTLDNKIWRLSNGKNFPIIDGQHYSFGGVYKKNKWTLDLDFYYKYIDGITALSLGYLNPTNPNFNKGNQKNIGVEFYSKKEFNPFNIWISYGISKIQNRFNNINSNQYFTASQQIKHNGTFSVAYKNDGFETALAWFVHLGRPYTKTSFDDQNNLIFDSINTEVLPFYHRLDFSATYQFHFSDRKDVKGKIGLSIRNLYNQHNSISKEYLETNSLSQPVKIMDVYGIKLTPNLLFRVWF